MVVLSAFPKFWRENFTVVFAGCGGRLQPEPSCEQHLAPVYPAGAERSTRQPRCLDRQRSRGEGKVQTQSKTLLRPRLRFCLNYQVLIYNFSGSNTEQLSLERILSFYSVNIITLVVFVILVI
jgi:hypothetical protein